jgi:hypothetical protein
MWPFVVIISLSFPFSQRFSETVTTWQGGKNVFSTSTMTFASRPGVNIYWQTWV